MHRLGADGLQVNLEDGKSYPLEYVDIRSEVYVAVKQELFELRKYSNTGAGKNIAQVATFKANIDGVEGRIGLLKDGDIAKILVIRDSSQTRTT